MFQTSRVSWPKPALAAAALRSRTLIAPLTANSPSNHAIAVNSLDIRRRQHAENVALMGLTKQLEHPYLV